MAYYFAPIAEGLGDLLLMLPALTALIKTGVPTYLVIRSPKQEGVAELIPGLAGSIKEPDFLKSRSPLFSAHKIEIPLLIAQGANDPRVKQAEAEQIVDALKSKGKPVEYMLFPDEGHGFAKPENRLKFYAAAEAFLARHLAP